MAAFRADKRLFTAALTVKLHATAKRLLLLGGPVCAGSENHVRGAVYRNAQPRKAADTRPAIIARPGAPTTLDLLDGSA